MAVPVQPDDVRALKRAAEEAGQKELALVLTAVLDSMIIPDGIERMLEVLRPFAQEQHDHLMGIVRNN